MTKFSVREFSDGLRHELAGHQVKVIALEPNLYRTSITDHMIFWQNQLIRFGIKLMIKLKNSMEENYKEKFELKLKHT